jgi:uncharacterized protein (UPF0303 family)
MTNTTYSITDLEDQERELILASFTTEDAWRVGSGIAERAVQEGLPVIIDVRRADLVLFRAAMTGSTPDQADWIEKKSAVAFRFQASSLLVGLRMASADDDPFAIGWLDPARHTLAGGAFPIRVVGAGVVAVATVSGLSSVDDHTLIIEQLREHKARHHADT